MDIKKTTVISKDAHIGKNTKIWHFTQVREHAKIGDNCIISKNCYIDHDVVIGNNVKIQNNSSIYYMTIIEDGVFIGPSVIFTNDNTPRAVDSRGELKTANEWASGKIIVKEGASIGAGSILLPDIVIGKYAMIGAGSIVTKDVPDYGLVYGNPAKLVGYVDKSGKRIEGIEK